MGYATHLFDFFPFYNWHWLFNTGCGCRTIGRRIFLSISSLLQSSYATFICRAAVLWANIFGSHFSLLEACPHVNKVYFFAQSRYANWSVTKSFMHVILLISELLQAKVCHATFSVVISHFLERKRYKTISTHNNNILWEGWQRCIGTASNSRQLWTYTNFEQVVSHRKLFFSILETFHVSWPMPIKIVMRFIIEEGCFLCQRQRDFESTAASHVIHFLCPKIKVCPPSIFSDKYFHCQRNAYIVPL